MWQFLSLSFPIWGAGLCQPLCGAAVATAGLMLSVENDQCPLGSFLSYIAPQVP